jgi:hypothetical protein
LEARTPAIPASTRPSEAFTSLSWQVMQTLSVRALSSLGCAEA